jgi:Holliday junction resolvasome RuvABC endonuclease subunit
MNSIQSEQLRVLGIAPSSRGFGFALMEGENTLVDWGIKSAKGDKNARSLSNVANLVDFYMPDAIALENTRLKKSRHSDRIKALVEEIVVFGNNHNIRVKLFSPKKLKLNILGDENGTKQDLAELLATYFPKELAFQLPKKRRIWMGPDYRMDIFDAVALANHFIQKLNRRTGFSEKKKRIMQLTSNTIPH